MTPIATMLIPLDCSSALTFQLLFSTLLAGPKFTLHTAAQRLVWTGLHKFYAGAVGFFAMAVTRWKFTKCPELNADLPVLRGIDGIFLYRSRITCSAAGIAADVWSLQRRKC